MKILSVKLAIQALTDGHLVALPTETVYGIAADATNPKAIKSIYKVKNRPLNNPCICHLANPDAIEMYAYVNKRAKRLFALWPGPLTLILKSKGNLPQQINNGSEYLALRIPKHPLCQQILEALPFPLAMPSANISGRESATNLEMVKSQLNHKVYGAVKGECLCGIESTIVLIPDNHSQPLQILRPGAITSQQLAQLDIVSPVVVQKKNQSASEKSSPSVPGSSSQHYAPQVPLAILTDSKKLAQTFQMLHNTTLQTSSLLEVFMHRPHLAQKVGYLRFGNINDLPSTITLHTILNLSENCDFVEAGKCLYASFYRLRYCSLIAMRTFSQHPNSVSLNDRLLRAARFCIYEPRSKSPI